MLGYERGADGIPDPRCLRVVPSKTGTVAPDHRVVEANQRICRMTGWSILPDGILDSLNEFGRYHGVDDRRKRSAGELDVARQPAVGVVPRRDPGERGLIQVDPACLARGWVLAEARAQPSATGRLRATSGATSRRDESEHPYPSSQLGLEPPGSHELHPAVLLPYDLPPAPGCGGPFDPNPCLITAARSFCILEAAAAVMRGRSRQMALWRRHTRVTELQRDRRWERA